MVIEEESQMDQSMISQVERSRIYSTSAASQAVSHVTGVAASAMSRKKKFVYVDVDKQNSQEEEGGLELDSSSGSEESDDTED